MTCAAHVQRQSARASPASSASWATMHVRRPHAGWPRRDQAPGQPLPSSSSTTPACARPKDLIGERRCCPSDNARDRAPAALSLWTRCEPPARRLHRRRRTRAERAGFRRRRDLRRATATSCARSSAPEINKREDRYGGSVENRSAHPVRDHRRHPRPTAASTFSLGVRLSPERFGLKLMEIVEVAGRLMRDGTGSSSSTCRCGMSSRSRRRPSTRAARSGSYFTSLDRKGVRLGAAGKVLTGEGARRTLEAATTLLSSAAPRSCTTISRSASPPIPSSSRWRGPSRGLPARRRAGRRLCRVHARLERLS